MNNNINLQILNNQYKDNLQYQKFMLLALDIFRWTNLPNGIESRYIEEALYMKGQAYFYNHPTYGFICLPCYNGTTMNLFGDWVEGYTMSWNNLVNDKVVFKDYIDINGEQHIAQGVRIQNNDLFTPTYQIVSDYCNRMYNIQQAIDLNVKQQKMPYIIKCNKQNELSYKTMMNKIEKGEYSMFVSKDLDLNSFEVFNLNVPFLGEQLISLYDKYQEQLLDILSISDTIDKKERVLESEQNDSNDISRRYLEYMYKNRLKARDLINEKFGLNIDVVVNSKLCGDSVDIIPTIQNDEIDWVNDYE